MNMWLKCVDMILRRPAPERMSVVLIIVFCVISSPVLSGETVTKILESSVPMVISGNWIYSPFTIVLTDTNITVNGYQYERPKKPEIKYEPEKLDPADDFVCWLVVNACDRAQTLINKGGTFEEAEKIMKDMILQYADDDTLKVIYNDGAFDIKYYKDKIGTFVNVPKLPIETISYREGWLEPRFRELVRLIELRFLVLKGVGYGQTFAPRNQSYIMPLLKKITERKYNGIKAGEKITIKGENREIRLSWSVIDDLLYPKCK